MPHQSHHLNKKYIEMQLLRIKSEFSITQYRPSMNSQLIQAIHELRLHCGHPHLPVRFK